MPKGADFAHDLIRMIFWGDSITGICDSAATPYTELYISLHTANPTSLGNQGTDEISYTGYARVLMARGSSAWGINGNTASPKNPIDFPQMTGGSGGMATNWSIGTSLSGSGKILYTGSITPAFLVENGVIPQIDTTTVITET